jgi:hypothetical protein
MRTFRSRSAHKFLRNANCLYLIDFIGDPGRIRTCDPLIRNQVLYPLSYGASSIVALALLVLGIITLGRLKPHFNPRFLAWPTGAKKELRSPRLCAARSADWRNDPKHANRGAAAAKLFSSSGVRPIN